MKLILFFLVAVCSGFDFDCLKGPDFWCTSYANARKCDKVEECFKYKKYKNQNTDEKGQFSQICIRFTSYVQENILIYTEQEFINLWKDKICLLVKSEAQTICKTFISEYGENIYNYIKKINSKDVCHLLFPYSAEDLKSPSIGRSDHNKFDPDICVTCKKYFQVAESIFSQITLNEFTHLLEKLCQAITNDFKSTCQFLVRGFGSQIYELIKTFLDGNRICPILHICPGDVLLSRIENENCETCFHSMVVLRKDLKNKGKSNSRTNVQSFICSKYALQDLCDGSNRSLMTSFISDIKSNLTLKMVCMKYKICQSFNAINGKTELKNVECDMCRIVALEVKKFLSDPNQQAIIKTFLKNQFCSLFHENKIQCQQVIDEFYIIVLNFIIAQFDVEKICHFAGICPTKFGIEPECIICESVIDRLIHLATSDHSQKIISNFLLQVCDHISTKKTECVELVKIYLPIVISIAKSSLNSKFICKQLNFCTKLSTTNVNLINKNSTVCEMCLFSIKEAREFLKNPAMQNIIKQFVKDEICIYFPTKEDCENSVNKYFPIVIKIIIDNLNSSLCNDIALCHLPNSSGKKNQNFIELIKSKRIETGCLLCLKFYRYVQKINDSNNKDNIQFCNRLQKSVHKQCLKQFKNFDLVVKAFRMSKNIAEFCQITKICSNTTVPTNDHLKLCVLGPLYWCASIHHATACGPGALRHCEINVWHQQPIL